MLRVSTHQQFPAALVVPAAPAVQVLEEMRVPTTVVLDSGVGYVMERWVLLCSDAGRSAPDSLLCWWGGSLPPLVRHAQLSGWAASPSAV